MNVIQIAQRAHDLRRATDWYSMFLNSAPTAVFDPPGLAFFDLDGLRLLLERGAPSALHYYHVKDLDRVVAELRARDVRIHTEPHTIFTHTDDRLGPAGSTERQAFVIDSEGNLVGLVEMVAANDQAATG